MVKRFLGNKKKWSRVLRDISKQYTEERMYRLIENIGRAERGLYKHSRILVGQLPLYPPSSYAPANKYHTGLAG